MDLKQSESVSQGVGPQKDHDFGCNYRRVAQGSATVRLRMPQKKRALSRKISASIANNRTKVLEIEASRGTKEIYKDTVHDLGFLALNLMVPRQTVMIPCLEHVQTNCKIY